MAIEPQNLIKQHGLISDQVDPAELQTVLEQLITSPEGAAVEFGCYVGTTSLYIRRVLDGLGRSGPFHVYDSFAGLPEKTAPDISPLGEQFRSGELAASKKDFVRVFQKAHLKPPIIHKAWFHDLTSDDVPDSIGFAFLDGDYYESIKQPLSLITPKLLPGAIIIVDDYANDALPGARRALDEWCKQYQRTPQTIHSLGIVRYTV